VSLSSAILQDREHNSTQKFKIVAVNRIRKVLPYDKAEYSFPLALVVGHEAMGFPKKFKSMRFNR